MTISKINLFSLLMIVLTSGICIGKLSPRLKQLPAVQPTDTFQISSGTVRQQLPRHYVCCERWSIESDDGALRAFDFCEPPPVWEGEHGKFVLRHRNRVLDNPECEEMDLVQRDFRELAGLAQQLTVLPKGTVIELSADGKIWQPLPPSLTFIRVNVKTLSPAPAPSGR